MDGVTYGNSCMKLKDQDLVNELRSGIIDLYKDLDEIKKPVTEAAESFDVIIFEAGARALVKEIDEAGTVLWHQMEYIEANIKKTRRKK